MTKRVNKEVSKVANKEESKGTLAAAKQMEIIDDAMKKYRRAYDAQSEFRRMELEDLKFSIGNSDNNYQWAPADLAARVGRPTMTINRIDAHIRQITNDSRQNRPGIKVRPADFSSSKETAAVYDGIIRACESDSDADMVYAIAMDYQARGGNGYFRVINEYESEDSFRQRPFIRPIDNPQSVLIDEGSTYPDARDANYAFIESRVNRDDFESKYPNKEARDWSSIMENSGEWIIGDDILICEYYERTKVASTLHLWANGSTSYEGDDMPEGVSDSEKPVQSRKADKVRVIWRKLTSFEVLEEREVPCEYIPIVRVAGNRWNIGGRVETSGLTRGSKDAQRSVNYGKSAQAEHIGLAPKSPFVAAAGAIANYEDIWDTANTKSHSTLLWNAFDREGRPMPMPQRSPPSMPNSAISELSATAIDDLKATTGIFDASLGNQGNEKSGVAIRERRLEGDTSNYHYKFNQELAIRQCGRILISMIPKLMDVDEYARLVKEDKSAELVKIDSSIKGSFTDELDGGSKRRTYNLLRGKYEVVATVGQSFATRKQEASNAMATVFSANPQLMNIVGDIFFRNQDWLGSDEAARRLKSLVPPQAIEAGEDNGGEDAMSDIKVQQLHAQIQQMQAMSEQMRQAALSEIESKNSQIAQLQNESLIKNQEMHLKSREIEVKEKLADISIMEKQRAMEKTEREVFEAESISNSVSGAIQSVQSMAIEALQQSEMRSESASAMIADLGIRVDQQAESIAGALLTLAQVMARPRMARAIRDSDGRIIGAESSIDNSQLAQE